MSGSRVLGASFHRDLAAALCAFLVGACPSSPGFDAVVPVPFGDGAVEVPRDGGGTDAALEPFPDAGPIGDGVDPSDGGGRVDGGIHIDGGPRMDGGARLDGGLVSDGGTGLDAGVPDCPSDMARVDTFCVDRFEAPNVEGALPWTMKTAYEGDAWCRARGKRLCTELEWDRACRGPSSLPYPYGSTYVRGRCDDDKTWIAPSWTVLESWPSDAGVAEAARLYQADPSGQRTACVSAEGVYDLTGNVAEWVVRSLPTANNYDHVLKGCYWAGCYGGSPPSCGFVNPAHPGGFRTYEAGFRCCR